MERMFQMSKILLVDDASFMRMMIKDALTKNGYSDLYEASDGVEAVSKYSEIKPDLVIMDITMPNMDGLEALKAIKKIDPKANVVMCSAMGQEAMVIDAIKSGARDFIVKPFKPERILKTVSTVLG
jgi:two-component system chemotaxis response regulator CheY